MRFLCIVPDEIFHQILIKDILLVHLIEMPVYKLFLNSPVEPLQTGIRFRMSWIIEEMSQIIVPAAGIKMFGKFTTIIGLNSRGYKRAHGNELLEEIAAIRRGI